MTERICINCRSFFEGFPNDNLCKTCENKIKPTPVQRDYPIVKDNEKICKKCGSKFIGVGYLCSSCYAEIGLDKNDVEGIDSHEKYWGGMF